MPILFLIGAVAASVMQTLFATLYNRKNTAYHEITPLYNVINFATLVAMWSVLYFTDSAFLASPSFDVGTVFYSLGFSVGFAAACIGLVNALNTGPVTLTSLILQFSCIGSTIYGFFFWGAEPTPLVIIGILLVCVSLVLCLYKGKGEKSGAKINGKWLIYVSLCFAGNMICMIVQREQQRRYEGAYGNQLMLVAMICALLLSIVLYLRSDRRDSRVLLRRAWFWPALAGVSNLLLNLFMMKLAVATTTGAISTSLIDPTIAVVPLALMTMISFFAFKEKLRWWQWVGIGVGIGASLLLSL